MTSYVLCKTGSLAVFKVTARDQGHYKGPSGAFVTYCNISCFIYLFAYSGRGMGEERGAPREKNESVADRDSSSPKSAIFQFLA